MVMMSDLKMVMVDSVVFAVEPEETLVAVVAAAVVVVAAVAPAVQAAAAVVQILVMAMVVQKIHCHLAEVLHWNWESMALLVAAVLPMIMDLDKNLAPAVVHRANLFAVEIL